MNVKVMYAGAFSIAYSKLVSGINYNSHDTCWYSQFNAVMYDHIQFDFYNLFSL